MGSVLKRSFGVPCGRIRHAVTTLLTWPGQCKQDTAEARQIDEILAETADTCALLLLDRRWAFLIPRD